MGIKIYGASDDLIEIEGDIREEFGFFSRDDDDSRVLAISDGTLLKIVYDKDGIWRISRLASGDSHFHKEEGSVTEDTPDVVTLSGIVIKWVALAYGEKYAVG